ncbi:adhesion G protein-coupled receptor E1-like [Poeciliopsis prolifica]|uniref:adhesion G protein-coupled receptor E1-like n=1 Tax=Poeciliopsis prolifica TaxID=188132 RepID=UPI0024139865|nr:adhesion G protein-coupled receptor E1-like [Poeciliopsis prolifica]
MTAKRNILLLDDNECDIPEFCGDNANCFNTNGSYYCQCKEGYRSKSVNFIAIDTNCKDINECWESKDICGPNASCQNTPSNYTCRCKSGFVSSTGVKIFHGRNNVTCRDICKIDETICGNGSCLHDSSGHYCACSAGFTNYGNKTGRCTVLHCDVFKDVNNLMEKFFIVQDNIKQLSESCLKLSGSEHSKELNEEVLLTTLLSMTDQLLFAGSLNDNMKVSAFFDMVEQALGFIGPLIKTPGTKISTNQTELELLVHTGSAIPQGIKTLSTKQAKVDIKMEEAAGDPSSYPGFTTVSLLSYSNLEESAEGFFSGVKNNESQKFKINSKVVTVSVSNADTKHLNEPVNITLHHLDQSNQTSHTCVFWDSSKDGGAWSDRGCSVKESNPKYTVCSCNHFGSFSVLMALYDIESHFELQLISRIGLSLSLICLFFCILTFSMIRSIKSTRTTIHLHLCISLFIATLVFLAGISQTQNKVGCAVVAGMLHFFYLAAFCWMCLEGIQLFRMVVLVFNTNFKTSYMMAGGYGVPAAIVTISALINANGYGDKKICWLNQDYIWSFIGPIFVFITVSMFLFLVTVLTLAQKFSSLKPDLDSLKKIKAFAVTAVAQLCILRTMWIINSFQLKRDGASMYYLFTIFSLQGVLLFIMHCLFSKQVRDEYRGFFSRCSAWKRNQTHASRQSLDTGEPNIRTTTHNL